MTIAAPQPLPPTKSSNTDIGVLKALLIAFAIVGVVGVIGYEFMQARADAQQLERQTKENAQKTDDLIRRAEELRIRCQKAIDRGDGRKPGACWSETTRMQHFLWTSCHSVLYEGTEMQSEH